MCRGIVGGYKFGHVSGVDALAGWKRRGQSGTVSIDARDERSHAVAIPKRPILSLAAVGGLTLLAKRYRQQQTRLDLTGKVVLITGGSRGLGLAMAEEFGSRGAKIVICARNELDLTHAAEHLRQLGIEALPIPCDIRDRDQVQQLVAQATSHFGHIDVLVNNAGTMIVGPLESQTMDDLEEGMNTMFWGTVYPTWEVMPQMRQRHAGHIVNITSIGGKVSVPHLISYNAAKFAAVGFSEGLHAELAKDGVQVLTVAPGLMRTGSYINALFKGQYRDEYTLFSLLSSTPLTAMSAGSAARHIVDATRDGKSEVTLTIQAKVLDRFHGLFPGTTANLLGLINRVLPDGYGIPTDEYHLGQDSRTEISESPITTLGRRAARRYNEHPESKTAT